MYNLLFTLICHFAITLFDPMKLTIKKLQDLLKYTITVSVS